MKKGKKGESWPKSKFFSKKACCLDIVFLYVHMYICSIYAYVCTVVVTSWSVIASSLILYYVYSFFYIVPTSKFYFL